MPKARRSRTSTHRTAPVPIARAVGRRIRELRKERGFSFDAFVGESELGRGHVNEIERGLVVPNLATLERIARTLEVTISDLVLGETVREQLFDACRPLGPADLRRLIAQAEAMGEAKKTE